MCRSIHAFETDWYRISICVVTPGDYDAAAVRCLASCQADILHVHVPNPGVILTALWAKPQVPIVVTYHSDHVRQRFRGLLFRPLERRFYRKVSAILTTTSTSSAFVRASEPSGR